MNNQPSNATINSFDLGYRVVDGTLTAAANVAAGTKNVATTATHSVTGFFSGMRYAVRERRAARLGCDAVRHYDAVRKEAQREAEMHAKRRRYEAAHRVPSTSIIILGG